MPIKSWIYFDATPTPMLLVFDSHITQVHVFIQSTLNWGRGGQNHGNLKH
jgi:hypothetical protein